MKKLRLFTPGPTMVPEEVLLEMARPQDHHRTAGFKEMFKDVTEHLQYLFQTKGACMTITGSGTAAGEAAVVSCCPPGKGHKVLCCRGGKFGERWAEVCQAFDIPQVNYDIEWGHGAKADVIDRMMAEDAEIDTVTVVHSETCSSSLSDVAAIAKVTRKRNALLIVDGITAIGAIPVKMDEWGVDVYFTGSQKSLMLPPGLGFAAVNDRAWERIDAGQGHQLIRGLQKVLHGIKERGLESVWAHTAMLARATRAAVEALGLRLFAADPVDSVTGIWVPESVDEGRLRKTFRSKFAMQIAGGQGHIKGKVIRISHMGYCDAFDTLAVIGALELVLHEMGHPVELGQGLAAAQKVFAETM
ncbi:MAG: pyridoxal-phosphate-dependent aminotransferase family protein [Planctomycetota bacterium]|jgi:aspartate aminotransferase-like enzyme